MRRSLRPLSFGALLRAACTRRARVVPRVRAEEPRSYRRRRMQRANPRRLIYGRTDTLLLSTLAVCEKWLASVCERLRSEKNSRR